MNETYTITDDDIAYISKELAKLTNGDAEIIAQELMAHIIIANVRNNNRWHL